MSSFTISQSATFTVTHARHMAAKIATDLKRIQRLYGSPSDGRIADYEAEAIALMKAGCLSSITYGFQRDGSWIEPTLTYTAHDLYGGSANDDDPGRIRPGKDVSGASFSSFLCHSDKYLELSPQEREAVREGLNIARTSGSEPAVDGYLVSDRTYSAGGRSIERASVRSQ